MKSLSGLGLSPDSNRSEEILPPELNVVTMSMLDDVSFKPTLKPRRERTSVYKDPSIFDKYSNEYFTPHTQTRAPITPPSQQCMESLGRGSSRLSKKYNRIGLGAPKRLSQKLTDEFSLENIMQRGTKTQQRRQQLDQKLQDKDLDPDNLQEIQKDLESHRSKYLNELKRQNHSPPLTTTKAQLPDVAPYFDRNTPAQKTPSREPLRPISSNVRCQELNTATTTNKTSVQPQAPQDNIQRSKPIVQINNKHYEKLELIGRGGSSKVYKVKSFANNKAYAIKRVTLDQFDSNAIKGFKGEIQLLQKLSNSDRVVKLIDYNFSDTTIHLVMELGEIDLAHVLTSQNSLDLNAVRFYASELFKCVQAVHQSGIVHSDLKPANFLFVRGVMKIIDFGIANALDDVTCNIYRDSQIGTPNYMAPEALIECSSKGVASLGPESSTWKIGKGSDIWSCGCILYQMVYGRPPYAHFNGNQRLMAIMNPQVQIEYSEKGLDDVRVPSALKSLMQGCLERDLTKRITCEEALNSNFLNPKTVSREFICDLVDHALKYGARNQNVTPDVMSSLCEEVWSKVCQSNN
ncbi:Dual-specificity kinase [Komagataella phaffii CBS 7435]|uniref:Dual-specificity kinase n=2 Tax=Komagataella phaffii TaxID=460519 RepID=C4R4M2_KOMPG|nr:Dual-specificity kinase [Komagataella phaffii GS115]AOA63184.1 GQ67_03531T0 [Komagataella phaffii]CAH2449730.1 Dual-specificity kinase [Komagataella phaffii CBS 7435]AOA69230.1 GQ68_03501T0 [Komagataella phaffii GS115]CAY70508.1 Dual-specificity kinase [Komagataella phaffii GS115]CCA39703.1 Dual-specificity kinase [Komagataella phaffii CBS 7435]